MDENNILGQLMTSEPSSMQRQYGLTKLREAMGGDPAFWGPLQKLLFGLPLYGRPQGDVNADMQSQMQQGQQISDTFPR